MKTYLAPTLDDLRLECVLVQAWKKTSAYIRAHNWYADTLELDWQSLRLPQFLGELRTRLETLPKMEIPALTFSSCAESSALDVAKENRLVAFEGFWSTASFAR